jgi:hypothetical protein
MATVTTDEPRTRGPLKPSAHRGISRSIHAVARRHALAGTQRTGTYARGITLQRARTWARHFWRPLLGLVALPPAVLVPCAVFFLRGPLRYFAVGAVAFSGLWLALLACAVFSGAVTPYVSVMAEEWTAADLRRIRRRGWRLVNGLKLVDQADIDHVAVGPGGVLVVETKWSADAWDLSDEGGFGARAAHRAVAQVARAAKQLHGTLGDARRGLPPRELLVRPVVVLYSPTGPAPGLAAGWGERTYEDWQVTVVHGSYLRQWLASLDGNVLGAEEVDRLWAALDDKVRGYETRRGAAPKPTMAALYLEWVVKPFAGSAGACFALGAVGSLHSLLVDLLSWSGATFLGALALRVKALRRLAVGWLPVWAFFFAVGVVVATVHWAR